MKSYKFDVELVTFRSTNFTIKHVVLLAMDPGCSSGKQSEGEQMFEVRIRLRGINLPGDFFTQLLCHAILVDALSISWKPPFITTSAAFCCEPMHISVVDRHLVVGIIPRSPSCQVTA